MPPRPWRPVGLDRELTEMFTRVWEEANVAYRRNVMDPEQARIISSLKQRHPTLTPNTALAGARTGLDPESPDTTNIATRDFQAQVRNNGFGLDDIGRWVGLAGGFFGGLALGEVGTEAHRGLIRATAGTGEAIGTGLDIARHGIGAAIPEVLRSGTKDVVRPALAALEVPLREIHRTGTALYQAEPRARAEAGLPQRSAAQDVEVPISAQWREFLEARREYGPSAGIRALSGEADLGQGFLPGGTAEAAAKAQREAVRDPRTGLTATPGSGFAASIVDPDSTAFDVLSGAVDLGIALADPTAIVGAHVAKARHARRLFTVLPEDESAGILSGLRRAVSGRDAERWFTQNNMGQAVIRESTAINDPYTMWNRLGRNHVPRHLAVDLANTRDEGEALQTWLTYINAGEVRSTDEIIGGLPTRIVGGITKRPLGRTMTKMKLDNVRMFGARPDQHLNVQDFDEAATVADDWLRNANVDEATRRDIINPILQGEEGFDNLLPHAIKAQGAVLDKLVDGGVPTELGERLTQMYHDFAVDLRHYYITKTGEDAWFPGVKTVEVGGELRPYGTPHIGAEYTTKTIPLGSLDDIRRIRRETSIAASIYRTLPARFLFGVHDFVLAPLTEYLWKPFVLLRGAIAPRVVGEEQGRMGAAGYDSLFSGHPISYLAWATGRKGGTNLAGTPWADVEDWAAISSRKGAEYRGATAFQDRTTAMGEMLTGARELLYKSNTDRGAFVDAWGGRLGLLSSDEVVRKVAGGLDADDIASLPEEFRHLPPNSLDAVKAWFQHGGGRQHLDYLARGGPGRQVLYEPGQAEAQIDTVWERLQIETGGHPDLMRAVADRGLRGVGLQLGEDKAAIRGVLDEFYNAAPDAVVHEQSLPMSLTGRAAAFMDKTIDAGFNLFMSAPTNYASRHPLGKQSYWRTAGELVPFMDADSRAHAITMMRRNKLDDLADQAQKVTDTTPVIDNALAWRAADRVAQARALKDVRDILYDVSRRGQIADVMRVWFPFLEPWKEMITRWSTILMKDPITVPRRVQQVIMHGERNGGFMRNDQGELMFTYPFMGKLASHLVNSQSMLGLGEQVLVPPETIRAQGRVSGLNMMGQFAPGAGPVIQIAASHILENRPNWNWLKDAILPFGATYVDSPEDLIEAGMPAWFRKVWDAAWGPDAEDAAMDDQLGGAIAQSIRILGTTGDYDLNLPEERARLQREATSLGRKIHAVRGALQFGLPTGPEFELRVDDKDGKFLTFQVLGDDYRAMLEKHGGAANPNADFLAAEEFVTKYGRRPEFAVQGRTYAAASAANTAEQRDWINRRPELKERYPSTWGFFAPNPRDELELEQWNEIMRQGGRRAFTREEMIQAAMNRRSWAEYRGAQQEIAGRRDSEARQYVREVREGIEAANPRWHDDVVPTGADRDTQLAELERAVSDPVLRDNAVAIGLRQWFQAVDDASQQARSVHDQDWLSSEDTLYLRQWLQNEKAPEILASYPEVAPVLERLWFRDRSIKWDGDPVAALKVSNLWDEDEDEDEEEAPPWA